MWYKKNTYTRLQYLLFTRCGFYLRILVSMDFFDIPSCKGQPWAIFQFSICYAVFQ